MYISAIALLLVAGTALAVPTDMLGATKAMMPCCPPKEWQAVMIDLKAQTALQYATLFAYDGNRKVEGSLTIPTGGSTPVYQTFTDYNTMTTYSVSMIGDPSTHKCEQTKAEHDFYDNCFGGKVSVDPNTIEYIGNTTFGAMTGGIPFDAWRMMLGNYNVTIALAKEKCTPLFEGVQGMNAGKKVDSVLLFNDFSDTITTKELVTMPPACVSMAKPIVG